jgi:quinol monooxygenase YgiN
MIVVQVEVIVEPGSASKVVDAVKKMETVTRQEPGCLTYAFAVDLTDPGMVRVIERWESLDAIKSHLASPHMAEFNQAVGALQPKGLDIKAFEVAREVALG